MDTGEAKGMSDNPPRAAPFRDGDAAASVALFPPSLPCLREASHENGRSQASPGAPGTMMARPFRAAFALAALGLSLAPAGADQIKNPTAGFAGLDKITGRIIAFEVEVDETVQFGALQMTPRVCYSRPPTESPQTTTFVEVDEVTLESKYRRIFTGWMFAASPGLHGIEHAVYDIWLTDCKGGAEVIAEAKDPDDVPAVGARPHPDAPSRRQTAQQPAGAQGPQEALASGGRIDVAPQRGVP